MSGKGSEVAIGRRWVFTINNPTEADEEGVRVLRAASLYCIVGREVGESDTPHLQGYVVFEKMWRRMRLARVLPRAYLHVAHGSSPENQAYCSKVVVVHQCTVGDIVAGRRL